MISFKPFLRLMQHHKMHTEIERVKKTKRGHSRQQIYSFSSIPNFFSRVAFSNDLLSSIYFSIFMDFIWRCKFVTEEMTQITISFWITVFYRALNFFSHYKSGKKMMRQKKSYTSKNSEKSI